MTKRHRALLVLVAGAVMIGCSPKADGPTPHRSGVLSGREFKAQIDERATSLVVTLCEDLVSLGCMPTSRLECRKLLTREVASCTQFTHAKVGESVTEEQRTAWSAHFSDCAYETVRSLVDMEREECRKSLI